MLNCHPSNILKVLKVKGHVFLWFSRIRSSSASNLNTLGAKEAVAGPATRVHADYDELSAPRRLQQLANQPGYTGIQLMPADVDRVAWIFVQWIIQMVYLIQRFIYLIIWYIYIVSISVLYYIKLYMQRGYVYVYIWLFGWCCFNKLFFFTFLTELDLMLSRYWAQGNALHSSTFGVASSPAIARRCWSNRFHSSLVCFPTCLNLCVCFVFCVLFSWETHGCSWCDETGMNRPFRVSKRHCIQKTCVCAWTPTTHGKNAGLNP